MKANEIFRTIQIHTWGPLAAKVKQIGKKEVIFANERPKSYAECSFNGQRVRAYAILFSDFTYNIMCTLAAIIFDDIGNDTSSPQ